MSPGAWDAVTIALKALTYAATFAGTGAVFFLAYEGSLVASTDRRRIRRMVPGLALVAVLLGGAQILVTAGSMSGDAAGMLDGSLLHMVWQAGAGRANAIRAIGLLFAAFAASPIRPAWLAFAGATMAATSFAWTGHARSLHPDALPIMLLGVHLLGIAFWLGALAPLALIARGRETARIAASAARFGAVAVFVVTGMLLAGIGLLWLMLGGVKEMWSSGYGRFVLLKLTFVASLLCLAAINKLRLTPRLLAGDSQALRSLRASIRLEMLLGTIILVVTAAFTTLAGPPALG